jgi:solute:Na+ symporter, SSS family
VTLQRRRLGVLPRPFNAIALVTPPSPIRGLDIRVAEDVDEALAEVQPEPALVNAAPPSTTAP